MCACGHLMQYCLHTYVPAVTYCWIVPIHVWLLSLNVVLSLYMCPCGHLLLLLEKSGSARLRERVIYTLSVQRPQTHYQPIDRKERKGKIEEDCGRDRAKMYWLGGETDSAIWRRKGTGVTSPRGTEEAGCSSRIFLKPSLKMPSIFCEIGCCNRKLCVNKPISFFS